MRERKEGLEFERERAREKGHLKVESERENVRE